MSRTHILMGAAVASLVGLALTHTASDQATWDRAAEALSILSKPGNPAGTYRITGAWSVEASNVSTLPRDTRITLLRNGVLTLIVNGATAMSFDFCSDQPWLTTGVSCGTSGGGCNSNGGGSESCAGANVDLNCMMVVLFGGAVMACSCSSGSSCYKVSGIALPGLTERSEVKLVSSGNRASALPEIPLLDDDNSVAVNVSTQERFDQSRQRLLRLR